MATELREFREAAIILCLASWCPACKGRVHPALQAGDDLILCPCERCGYMLICRDLGAGGEYLTAPDDELWASLLASHGAEIRNLKRMIALEGDGPDEPAEDDPLAAPFGRRYRSAFWRDFNLGLQLGGVLAAVGCVLALGAWLVLNLVRRQ